jgi:hypothetical protein
MFGHKPTIKKLALAISLALPFGLYAAEKDVDENNEKVSKTKSSDKDTAAADSKADATQLPEVSVIDIAAAPTKGYLITHNPQPI